MSKPAILDPSRWGLRRGFATAEKMGAFIAITALAALLLHQLMKQLPPIAYLLAIGWQLLGGVITFAKRIHPVFHGGLDVVCALQTLVITALWPVTTFFDERTLPDDNPQPPVH